MKISKSQVGRLVKDLRRALSLLELELEVRDRKAISKRSASPNAISRVGVVALAREMGHPVTPEMLRRGFAKRGQWPTIAAITSHVHAAYGKGELVKLSRGLYEAAPVDGAVKAAAKEAV